MPKVDTSEILTGNPARSAANFIGEVPTFEGNPYSDEEDNMRELERAMQSQRTTAVIWNPFRDQNNLCSGGTYGDSGIATLTQFVPHVLFLKKVPRITPKRPDEQAILLGETVVGSDVAQVARAANETAQTLLKIHGAVGAVMLESLADNDFNQISAKLLIYEVVMQGWNKQGLLEDLPEYFGTRSPHLPEKFDAVPGNGRDNSFTMTAEEVLEKARKDGVLIEKVYSKVMEMEPKHRVFLSKPCVLSAKEIAIGKQLIEELRNASLKMHDYAVGAEGVLPKSKEHLESVKRGPTFGKQKLDELDRYLMRHFPSYPMDSEIEKSERNQRRATESIMKNFSGRGEPDNSEELRLLREQNRLLAEQNKGYETRLAALEKGK